MMSFASSCKRRSPSTTDWSDVLSTKRSLVLLLCVIFATLGASLIYIWGAQTNLDDTAKIVTTIVESILLIVIGVAILFVQAGFFRMMYNQEGMRYPSYLSLLFAVVAFIAFGISVTALAADSATIPSETTRWWIAGTSGLIAVISASTALFLRTTLIGVNYEALVDYAGKQTYGKDLLSIDVFKSDNLKAALSSTGLNKEQVNNLVNSATYGQFLTSAKDLLTIDEMKQVNQFVKTARPALPSAIPSAQEADEGPFSSSLERRFQRAFNSKQVVAPSGPAPLTPAQLLQADEVPTENPFETERAPRVVRPPRPDSGLFSFQSKPKPQPTPRPLEERPQALPGSSGSKVPEPENPVEDVQLLTDLQPLPPPMRLSRQTAGEQVPGQFSAFGEQVPGQFSAFGEGEDQVVRQRLLQLQREAQPEGRLLTSREQEGVQQRVERPQLLTDIQRGFEVPELAERLQLTDVERPQLLTDIQRGFEVPELAERLQLTDVERPQLLTDIQRGFHVPEIVEPAEVAEVVRESAIVPPPRPRSPPRPRGFDFTPEEPLPGQLQGGRRRKWRKAN
jgi:hypothetical protein